MRETTKDFVGGKITRIVGGTSTTEAENIEMWADNITFIAGGKTIFSAEEGINYGNYVPPEEVYTTHPKVEKVEFLDENEKILNQNTKDFYYGQKLKIKVTTSNAKGDLIIVDLQGKSKSKNQKFDVLDTKQFSWNGTVTQDEIFETPYFVLNPNWYSDDYEKYNYDTHQTEIEEDDLNEFYALVTLNAKDVYLPLEGERLKPITYKRNYEELIGLFKTDNTGAKDLLENYENLYIDKYADENDDIKDIVDDFSEWLCEDNTEATIEEIQTKVSESAEKLWETAVWQHKEHISTIKTTNKETGEEKVEQKERKAILDDRPLYWARIAMQVILKRQYVFIKDILTLPQKDQDDFFIKSIVPKKSKLAEVIQLFEEKSRNYTGINFNVPEANGCKKVLITGFDPFILNQFDNDYLKSVTNPNIKQSNPSGVVALSLADGKELGAFIQTMVVPVRYTDFDSGQSNNSGQGKGIIEKYIGKFIPQVDMIITISQAGPNDYNIDKYATATRGGFNDNQDYIRIENTHALSTSFEWIETTLPKEFTNISNVEYNWNYDDKNGQITPPKLNQKIHYGSGGDYLSNEIFYRVAKLRKELRPNLATGHFHISKIQGKDEDLETNEITQLLDIVKKAISEGIKGI